jgi:hypothetical protein
MELHHRARWPEAVSQERREDCPMNLCRTCKYWSVNAYAIGLGECLNTDALRRVVTENDRLRTTHDFGCPFHQTGSGDNIESIEEQRKSATGFIEGRKPYWEFESTLVMEDRAAEQTRIAKQKETEE